MKNECSKCGGIIRNSICIGKGYRAINDGYGYTGIKGCGYKARGKK